MNKQLFGMNKTLISTCVQIKNLFNECVFWHYTRKSCRLEDCRLLDCVLVVKILNKFNFYFWPTNLHTLLLLLTVLIRHEFMFLKTSKLYFVLLYRMLERRPRPLEFGKKSGKGTQLKRCRKGNIVF